MADTYHLYIHLGDGGTSAMAGGADNQTPDPEQNKTSGGIQKAVKNIVGYASVKSFAEQFANGYIGQVELSTGAREYEARLKTTKGIVNQFWSMSEAIVGGALFGGLGGAVAGLALSGIHTLINYNIQAAELQKEQTLENATISMLNVRAGVAGRRSREQ